MLPFEGSSRASGGPVSSLVRTKTHAGQTLAGLRNFQPRRDAKHLLFAWAIQQQILRLRLRMTPQKRVDLQYPLLELFEQDNN